MSLFALTTLLLNQQPTFELNTEMARVFKGLVEIAQPSNIGTIRSALSGPGPLGASWERANGGRMWGFGTGMSLVHFTDRSDFRSFSTAFPKSAGSTRADGDLRNEALQVIDLIGYWGETRSTQLRRDGANGATVTVRAHFGDMAGTHDATVTFAASSLALKSVFMWDRLDYTRFRNATRVSRDSAKQAAIAAYDSFAPFPVAQVGTVRPYFGIPASAEIRPPAWHEMTPQLLDLCRQYVALPLYYIDFFNVVGAPNHFGGTNQTVVIDAMSGRAIVLYPNSTRANGPPVTKRIPFGSRLEVSLPTGETGAIRKVEAGDVAGQPMGIGVNGLRVQARFDSNRGVLFLPDGRDWRAYQPDQNLDAALRQPAKGRKPFGGGPYQSYRPGIG